MPIESPVPGVSSEEGKKKKITIVDVSSAIEDKARDVAEAKLTASKKELKGFKGFFQKIWKHNLAREYYRQKEIILAKEKIEKTGNLHADETDEKDVHDRAMGAVIERFTSEFDEAVHAEAGEKKESLGETEPEKAIKSGVKKLIQDYAVGAVNEEAFLEEKNRLLSQVTGVKKDVVDKGSMYADNLLEIAKQTKEAVEHGAKLDELDLDFEVVVGQAKMGARTEAQYNAVDRIVHKIESTKAGKWFNEATVTSAVAIAYSIGAAFSQRIARSRLAAWGSFGATAVLGAGIAGAREGKKLEDERRQHAREMAQGKQFDPAEAPRRKEMEEYRLETKKATDLLDALNGSLYEYENGERKAKKLDQVQLDEVLGNLTEIESRITLSDRSKIDLISFSNTEKLESERLQLDIARATAKVEIQKILAGDPSLKVPAGANLAECLQALKDAKVESLTSGDKGIEAKNRMFRKMKAKNIGKAALKGMAYGLVIGGAFQEGVAFFRDNQEGVLEHGWNALKGTKAIDVGEGHYTPLEYLRRLALGEFPRIEGDVMHEAVIGDQHLKLPEGVNLIKAADGTYKFLRGEDVLAENLEVNPNGTFTADSWRALEDRGVIMRTDLVEQVTGESRAPSAIIEKHQEWFQKIKRDLWYDNDTPKPVFDKNELKLWWGGAHNSGVDASGNYVFNVKHMLPDGSYHGKFSANAGEAFAGGKLKMLLSLSRDTQGSVVEIPIDASGNAVIDPKSDIGKMFFDLDGKGHAVFKGKFAEVAEMMEKKDGLDHVRILATHEGMENPSAIPIVEKTPYTIFDFPDQYTVDPPPIIPIFGRRPLERLTPETPPVYYFGGSGGYEVTRDVKERHEKERSRTLKDNPDALLDHFQEIDQYFKKQENGYLDELKEIAGEMGPMIEACRLSICIPVAGHQEGNNIYQTLENYSRQTADNDKFEIVLFVNRPEKDRNGKKIAPDKTISEIRRFMKDHPEMNIRVAEKVLPIEDANIGHIRKLINDAVLLRQHARGSDAKDLIMVSNDADNKGVSYEYVDNFISKFETHGEVDSMVGQLDWDIESFIRNPLIHIGTRLFQYSGAQSMAKGWHFNSSGANFAFRSSIYAAVGGYAEGMSGGEDTDLGTRILSAREGAKKRKPIVYAGSRVSRIFTSSRRAESAMKTRGLAPIEQWDNGFSAFDDEVRKVKWEDGGKRIDYKNPKEVERLITALQDVINRTIKRSAQWGVSTGDPLLNRSLGWLGIKYEVTGSHSIKITDATKLIKALEKYQEEGLRILERKTRQMENGSRRAQSGEQDRSSDELGPEVSAENGEKQIFSVDAVKDIIRAEIGNRAKIKKLDIRLVDGIAQIESELDAGLAGGTIRIKGSLENKEGDIAVRNMNVDARGYVKTRIENSLSSLAPDLKKYFEEKRGKSVSSIQIVESGFAVGF